MLSVALQNFDARGQLLFGGRVNKNDCVAWELYGEPSGGPRRAERPGKLLLELYMGQPKYLDLGAFYCAKEELLLLGLGFNVWFL